jgi:hypothetical protein
MPLAAITHVGLITLLTGAILIGGYAFIALGSTKAVQPFSLFMAIFIVGAMFGELIIFSPLLARSDPKP